jgi:hypothetical protein
MDEDEAAAWLDDVLESVDARAAAG